jgi:mRNA-degrading endonuclease toxin of MazEF toxin-antitoxin module
VARRGDVLVSLRKLGFGDEGKAEEFVVLQADALNAVPMPTVVVAPLIADDPAYVKQPLAVKVARKDGSQGLVLVWLLAAVPTSRFQPAAAWQLPPGVMAAVERVTKVVLDLP